MFTIALPDCPDRVSQVYLDGVVAIFPSSRSLYTGEPLPGIITGIIIPKIYVCRRNLIVCEYISQTHSIIYSLIQDNTVTHRLT